jgi:hypothetical protein
MYISYQAKVLPYSIICLLLTTINKQMHKEDRITKIRIMEIRIQGFDVFEHNVARFVARKGIKLGTSYLHGYIKI